jgi:hypothetical protein
MVQYIVNGTVCGECYGVLKMIEYIVSGTVCGKCNCIL